MRVLFSTAVVALTCVALAAGAAARSADRYQINVILGDSGCTLETSVSRVNTIILWHVINDGTVAHRFTVWGVTSGWLPPRQEGRFYVNFHRPGHYPFACKAQGKVLRSGTFTIRKT